MGHRMRDELLHVGGAPPATASRSWLGIDGLSQLFHWRNSSLSWSTRRNASIRRIMLGLAPPPVGKTEVVTTETLPRRNTRRSGSTIPEAADDPIRVELPRW